MELQRQNSWQTGDAERRNKRGNGEGLVGHLQEQTAEDLMAENTGNQIGKVMAVRGAELKDVAGVLKDVAGVTGDAIFPFSNF
jgi:hypothetical protein